MIILKTKSQIDLMDEANKIVHLALDHAAKNAEIGMTSRELDSIVENYISAFKHTTSAFKGYMGYPNVSCISINAGVVHGIPNNIPLQDGDIISIDIGVYYKGWAGDSAITFILGNSKSDEDVRLIKETRKALYAGIEQMVIGNRLHDIGEAINNIAIENAYGNVRGFSGHGIGQSMHESPSVYNYIEPRESNVRLQEGMVLALEPMFSTGTADVHITNDKWTVVTNDNKNSAHWEVSAAITKDGPKILGYYDS